MLVEKTQNSPALAKGEIRTDSALIPPARDWRGQFTIETGTSTAPAEFRAFDLGGVIVSVAPSVPIFPVQNARGAQIGLFLGVLVDYRGRRLVRGPIRLDEVTTDAEWTEKEWRVAEDTIYRHAGRFVCILGPPGGSRLYLDAGGAMSVVFEPTLRRAAATTGLLFDDREYVERFRADLFDRLNIEGEGWFPSFLTAHRGVRRILCNHYLDLRNWSLHRHWPRRGELQSTTDGISRIDRVATVVEEVLATLVDHGKVVCGLTAGHETRLLLASARRFLDDVSFVTLEMPDSENDVATARSLAARFNLRHRVLPAIRASEDEARLWQYTAGHCVGGTLKYFHPSVRHLADYSYLVGGAGGEVARAFFWRPADSPDMRLSARSLVSRFGMPIHDDVVEATETWLAHAPDADALVLLDLAYLELRLSPWGFAGVYGADPCVDRIDPIINREAFRLMLELPQEAKRSAAMFNEAVHRRWPGLLELPFNRYGDYRDGLRLIKRAVKNPRLVVKKLRKTFG